MLVISFWGNSRRETRLVKSIKRVIDKPSQNSQSVMTTKVGGFLLKTRKAARCVNYSLQLFRSCGRERRSEGYARKKSKRRTANLIGVCMDCGFTAHKKASLGIRSQPSGD